MGLLGLATPGMRPPRSTPPGAELAKKASAMRFALSICPPSRRAAKKSAWLRSARRAASCAMSRLTPMLKAFWPRPAWVAALEAPAVRRPRSAFSCWIAPCCRKFARAIRRWVSTLPASIPTLAAWVRPVSWARAESSARFARPKPAWSFERAASWSRLAS